MFKDTITPSVLKEKYHFFNIFHRTDIYSTILFAFFIISIVLSILFILFWLYYTMYKNKNSKDMTGIDVAKTIFEHDHSEDIVLNNSICYLKYWNYSERKNTFRLRWWTSERRSLWTIAEAAQQVYATTIRKKEPIKFWLVFRLPVFIYIIEMLLAIIISTSINSISIDAYLQWNIASLSIAELISLAYTLRYIFLNRNIMFLINSLGLEEAEVKHIKLIFRTRLIMQVLSTIMSVIFVAVYVAGYVSI